MRIVPDSSITLYKDVDIDNEEQLVFKNIENQQAYFRRKVHPNGGYTPCTVVRKTGVLRVEKSMAIVSQCNYLSFVNPIGNLGDNKTVYARILDYDYVNNECTEIAYVIDYWQTWMFDVTFQDMYIEREHLSQADWDKAEENPYDQSILEFKTSESLPYGHDIEKPYYTFGTTSSDDGVYCGEAVTNALGVPNEIGVLIAFSDIDLQDLDTNQPVGQNAPSADFSALLDRVRSTDYPVNFFKLSNKVFTYLNTLYPQSIVQPTYKGSIWSSTSFGSITPATSNLRAPVSYIYIESGGESFDDTATTLVSDILAWFTTNSCLDSLIGLYPIQSGLILFSGRVNNQSFSATLPTASTQQVVNKKLDLYPYTYYRLMAPNGDIKELRIEDFKTAQDGTQSCEVALSMDIVEKPNLIVAPVGYKVAGASPNNPRANVNVREGLILSQFPTLPYSIDAFLSQMAAVANAMIGNNTIQYANELKYKSEKVNDTTITNLAGGVYDTVVNAGVGMATGQGTRGGVSGAATKFRTAMLNEQYSRPLLENEAKMVDDAYNVLRGGTDGAIYENFEYTKPAYACDIYNQVNGDGIVNFNNYSFIDIVFMRVALHPQILAQYDRYFSNYGYTSGRCGIPRVIQYARNAEDDANLPHWQALNGKNTTYIKTRDCKVIHSMLPVAQFIKAMFDTGVRMIQGDPSDG